MASTFSCRVVWQTHNCPAGNVPSSDHIRIASVATGGAKELRLRLTIGLVDMPTCRTRSAGIAWIDEAYQYTRKQGLVDHKRLQLCEGPRLQYRALRLSSPHPRLDMRQCFQRYSSIRAFSHLYQSFRDHMIGMAGKAVFLPRQLAKATPRAVRALALQFATKPSMPVAHAFDCATTVDRAVAIHGDVRDAHIDAEHPFNVDWLRGFNVADRYQIERAVHQREIGFTVPRLEQCPLALTTHERDRLPAVKRPDRHGRIFQVPTQDAIIVGDAADGIEGVLGIVVQLVAIGNFGKAADDHLCRQAVLISDASIDQLLKLKLAEGLRIPGHTAHIVAGSISPFKRALQGVGLIVCRKELQLGDQFHIVNILWSVGTCNPNKSGIPPLPLKWCGFLPTFL